MSRYTCCQGYFNCCCFKSGSLGEETCPTACLCLEAFLCSNLAVSASRMYVMDKYQLSSDPCDYRLIRLSNMLQLLSCVCHILSTFDREFLRLTFLIDHLADFMYHAVSSCMTAQTAYEVDYQRSQSAYIEKDIIVHAEVYAPTAPLAAGYQITKDYNY